MNLFKNIPSATALVGRRYNVDLESEIHDYIKEISEFFHGLFFGNTAVFIWISCPNCALVVNILQVTVARGLWQKQKWQ